MIYGLIISAGNQTRFKKDTPKALQVIKDKILLDTNILNLEKVCNEVYVVCSTKNEDYFKNYKRIVIESGLGCGDAVMKALQNLILKEEDLVFIQWGDSYQDKTIYKYMLKNYKGKVLVPCILEFEPYTSIYEDDGYLSVRFKKYGEVLGYGYHDLSVFLGNAIEIKDKLEEFAKKISFNGKYKHKHNNEMTFLDVFNETTLKGQILTGKNFNGFSFNTIEELEKYNGSK